MTPQELAAAKQGLLATPPQGSGRDLAALKAELLRQAPAKARKPEMGFAEKAARTLAPKSVEGFGETLGTAAAIATGAAGRQDKAAMDESEARFELAKQLRTATPEQAARIRSQLRQPQANKTFLETTPAAAKTARQVAAEGLGVLGTAALGATPGLGGVTGKLAAGKIATSVGSRIATGTLIGAGAGVKHGLEGEGGAAEVIGEGLKGAAIGAAVSGAFEGLGYVARRIARSRAVEKGVGKIYTNELKPPRKELAQDIERGFKTFGEQASKVKDRAGNPVYVGDYDELLTASKRELNQSGSKLMRVADKFGHLKASRDDVAAGLIDELQETYGKLSKAQMNQIRFEISRMPKTMNVRGLITSKRMYDRLIPDSFWLNAGDPNVSFISNVKYALRDRLRELVNTVPDAGIKELNQRMSIAMDMQKLTASQLAARQLQGHPTGLWNAFSRLVERYILNPGVTLRAAQGVSGLGSQTGQGALRHGARTLLIEGAAGGMGQ